MFSLSLSRGLESLSDRLGADVIVVPAGYKAEIESVLLKGEPPILTLTLIFYAVDFKRKLRKLGFACLFHCILNLLFHVILQKERAENRSK